MDKNIVEHKRKSYMEIGEIYFWPATINNWQRLLQKDMYKDVVINSLEHPALVRVLTNQCDKMKYNGQEYS